MVGSGQVWRRTRPWQELALGGETIPSRARLPPDLGFNKACKCLTLPSSHFCAWPMGEAAAQPPLAQQSEVPGRKLGSSKTSSQVCTSQRNLPRTPQLLHGSRGCSVEEGQWCCLQEPGSSIPPLG